ncbi:metal ABC transporter ATP-binding protein [Candidatus Saccharibacteria bacterium]|nr:metal ABC transporter ATP-binding protein [Candidatus Saccharibacteria bacterium]
MKNEILKLEKLTLGFGDNIVIKSADLSIKQSDFVCVVGANGSGKSTLIKGALGLIKPMSGRVFLKDDLKIGYLPQETNFEVNFPATVREIVMSGVLNKMGRRVFYNSDDYKLMTEKLKLLKIVGIQKKTFSELSGGQKQKVLLARALMATSELLILDEPSNNLDYKSRQEFYEILLKLNHEGLTIIMITHDLDVEDLIGNKVVAIQKGEIKEFTTVKYLEKFK